MFVPIARTASSLGCWLVAAIVAGCASTKGGAGGASAAAGGSDTVAPTSGGASGIAGTVSAGGSAGGVGEDEYAGAAGAVIDVGLAGGAGTTPSQLAEPDFVGIIWSLESYDGQPPDAGMPPSLLIYHEDRFFSDRHCGVLSSQPGFYVRDGALFSGSFDEAYPELYAMQQCEDGSPASFVPFGLLNGQYTMQVGSGSLTLDGAGRAVYRSEFTAPVEGSGLTGRGWHLVESDHPEFEATGHLDYVVQFESHGIRDLRVAWACGEVQVADCNEAAGSFAIDGNGGIDLHWHENYYSLPASLAGTGNSDRALVTDLATAADYQLSGTTLTLRSHAPEVIDYVFDERGPAGDAGGQGGAGGSGSSGGSSGAGAD